MLVETREPRPLVEQTPRVELRDVVSRLRAAGPARVVRWPARGGWWAARLAEDGATGRVVALLGGGRLEVAEVVRVAYRGGYGPRWTLLCPRCGARVRTLYARGYALACRACHGLAWASQRMTPGQRELATRGRVAAALGLEDEGGREDGPYAFLRYGDRPRGMRFARYGRLSAKLAKLSEASAERFASDCFAVFSGQRPARFSFPNGYTHTAPRLRQVPDPVPLAAKG